eukprot:scaffold16900_cov105-Isochrysis_galbana.AAC.5
MCMISGTPAAGLARGRTSSIAAHSSAGRSPIIVDDASGVTFASDTLEKAAGARCPVPAGCKPLSESAAC